MNLRTSFLEISLIVGTISLRGYISTSLTPQASSWLPLNDGSALIRNFSCIVFTTAKTLHIMPIYFPVSAKLSSPKIRWFSIFLTLIIFKADFKKTLKSF